MIYSSLANDFASVRNIITSRAVQILCVSLLSMIICQVLKFIILSIKEKKFQWRLLISTGGFPSSHTALCIAMCITIGMFQWHDLNGNLDWSFAVAVIISVIVIHDAMGVRLEASKHAKILNNLVADMTNEEKQELGYGKKGELNEMLGHKGLEVIGGIIIGIIVCLIGFFILV